MSVKRKRRGKYRQKQYSPSQVEIFCDALNVIIRTTQQVQNAFLDFIDKIPKIEMRQ